MVLANCSELNFNTMKAILRRTFSDSAGSNGLSMELKEEPVFAIRTESQVAENRVFWSSRHRGKHSRNRGGSANAPYDKYKRPIKGKNPADQHGNTTTCKVCGSKNHWERNCPDNRDSNGNQEPGFSTSEANVYLTFADVTGVLLKESFGCCIIDTACTATWQARNG